MGSSIGLYIHVPFCRSKCYYCDFNSYPGMEHFAGSYFNALTAEIEHVSGYIGNRRVKTVFIGGGTPTLVEPEYITNLLEICSKYFNLDVDAEISIESNPGTISYNSLKAYREAGINRLSIGLQAWQDRLLKSLGRIHDRKQFVDNFEEALRAGFDNINVDLIFGLPGQTLGDWDETLEAVTSLPVKHISCYSLQIEEGTVFGNKLKSGELVGVDEELDREMYEHAVVFLTGKGFRHYEISNFAQPGYECRHNLVYWKAEEYAGFGAGAHSYINGVRYCNTAGIERYIKAVNRMAAGSEKNSGRSNIAGRRPEHLKVREMPDEIIGLYKDIQYIDRNESMSEFMILGLRLIDGISEEEFENRFGEKMERVYGNVLGKLEKEGLIIYDREKGTYRLSRTGLNVANRVFVEFI